MHGGVKVAKQLIEAAGLFLLHLDVPRSGHVKAKVQRADGATALFVFAGSTSDHRASQNNLCRLRRFARGNYTPIQERS